VNNRARLDAMRKAAAARPGTGGSQMRMDVALGPAAITKGKVMMRNRKRPVVAAVPHGA
jgi:hypothetical protein